LSAEGPDTQAVAYDVSTASALRGRPPLGFGSSASARLLDVVDGRPGTVLADWLADRDPDWRAAVTTASLDPFRYATALTTELPDAARVLDPFYVAKLGLTCVDEVRRRVQQDTSGHRGRARLP
jgi:transposase